MVVFKHRGWGGLWGSGVHWKCVVMNNNLVFTIFYSVDYRFALSVCMTNRKGELLHLQLRPFICKTLPRRWVLLIPRRCSGGLSQQGHALTTAVQTVQPLVLPGLAIIKSARHDTSEGNDSSIYYLLQAVLFTSGLAVWLHALI